MQYASRLVVPFLVLLSAAAGPWRWAAGVARAAPGAEPTHRNSATLCATSQTKVRKIGGFCLDSTGSLLVCDQAARAVKVITPRDKLLATWRLDFGPEAITCAPGGDVFVGGGGQIARLDSRGRLLKAADTGWGRREMTALATNGKDVFASVSGNLGFAVYRCDRDLGDRKQIVDGLRGCCGQMDIAWIGGALRAAENGRKRIVTYGRDGKQLGTWAKADERDPVDSFGSCCNPKNLCAGPGGGIYTSESDVRRVKRYSTRGELLAVVGNVSTSPGCLRVCIAANHDGSRIYVMDETKNVIRVMEGPAAGRKAPGAQQAGRATRARR